MKSLYALLCAVVFCGCSNVLLQKPLPETILSKKERDQLAGTWIVDKSTVFLEFTADGSPKLVSVEWENENFNLKNHHVVFSKTNETIYASLELDENESGTFSFAELNLGGEQCLVWTPLTKPFEELVENRQLSGTVEKGTHTTHVLIDASPEDVLQLISTNHTVFDYKNPLIFRKLD